jgi:hypothetical protein
MRRGRQAADDGSFARSVGAHTARGALLIAIAVILGLVLLQKVDTGKGASTSLKSNTPTTAAPTTAPAITTTTRPASAVKVLVANGTTTTGVALQVKQILATAGYNALAPADATAAAKAARRNTIVYYAPGYDKDAVKVASHISVPPPPTSPMPNPLPVSDLKTANVLVLVGPDYVGRSGASTTAGGTTTTTRNL